MKTNKKSMSVAALSILMFLSVAGKAIAANYGALTIYPAHVGVFTTVGVQQFLAFGISDDGAENITKEVTWESSDESIVTIDENGLATVAEGKTFGQVKITCTWPKVGKPSSGPNLLLLSR